MNGGGSPGQLVASEVHGFRTWQELDVKNLLEEAGSRWLRPNEIHAILCNCNNEYFPVNVKPVHLPKSGTIVLFDRKMLRNFRKDGHNWKKKKDGKTVKEAHEHLKVGNEERIHVYYAHGQDNPTFVRRCYWLLDKNLEHIVLVHYRETQELQLAPATPVNSNSSSVSDQSPSRFAAEEFDSGAGTATYAEPGDSVTVKNHERRLRDLNTLEWDELLVTNSTNETMAPKGDQNSGFSLQNQFAVNGSSSDQFGSTLQAFNVSDQHTDFINLTEHITKSGNDYLDIPDGVFNQTMGCEVHTDITTKDSGAVGTVDSIDVLVHDRLQSQDSLGNWMNYLMTESPISIDDHVVDSSVSSDNHSVASSTADYQQSNVPEQIFTVTDISPAWAYSAQKTKILITGFFHPDYQNHGNSESNLYCVCGDVSVRAEIVQVGVYRCFVSQNSPGLVNLYMSFDGHKPISQVLNFEYCTPLFHNPICPPEDQSKWEEFQLQLRLAHLLFSTSRSLNIVSSKVSSNIVKEAKKFAQKTTYISNNWAFLIKSIEDSRPSFTQAKDGLFEVVLKNKLKEWLLERIAEGCKTTEYDVQGLGVIHLCAILGYTWAIPLFSWSGLSVDFRDKHGWTALHWAAYYGREKMVAVLLSAGAKPNYVTDPTSKNPGGLTAADLASRKGYDGLAAYLSEQALVKQFEEMAIAGNVSGTLQTSSVDVRSSGNITEEGLYLKDTLAAYCTAADAAARIQLAFREHSLKIRTKAVQSSNPEDEARNIVAAMKIQHAFRNHATRKKMVAAARIQYRFRSWKMRREFLNVRRHVIKIQATFRGFQVRKQYRKILWSVGVLEKVILRWRLKRKGFRGLCVNVVEPAADQRQEESDSEEDFYRTSRKQAEERVDRAVVRVHAMIGSKKTQEEYQRMKLTHNQATLEYEEFHNSDADIDMDTRRN
ncbi:hypothetical protein SLEP1_g40074 [Rubroshorea leprosula]|uniref:CG-1 domain-containing protein n=2 Tax=Rubroshorea leprosula TaxID=152421 RepID=A0AAV5L2X0_9ROSI|nr:hypothetical protein SLEP1_g40074 [Rubroshorea leprosula]